MQNSIIRKVKHTLKNAARKKHASFVLKSWISWHVSLFVLFRFLFSEMIYIDKTFLYQTKLPSCTSICLVLFMVVTEHIEILWKLRKKFGPSSLEKKLQLLGFASVSLYYIFWFIYLVENSSDQKINVIFLVHRSNSSFWNELMKRLLRKFFELSAF